MNRYSYFLVGILLLSTTFCMGQTDSVLSDKSDRFSKKPCSECDSIWKRTEVAELVKLLEKSTKKNTPVWPGYKLGDATIILEAGKTIKGDYCLGLWKKGKHVSYAKISNTLSMLTFLYSYYLNYTGMDSIPQDQFFSTARNAPAFKQWMNEMNISSAVYLPVDFSKLPFKIPSIVKLQLAIHEAFHVEVMLKYWYTKKGNWPEWDKQPDRNGMQTCYTHNDSTRTFIQKELATLADVVEALLDGKKEKVCSLGNKYLGEREERYGRLKDVVIKRKEESNVDCRTAESLLELEEGLADYASWTLLFNMNMVSKEDLLKRYRAKQDDHFYLSGCMLLHAITLMSKERAEKIINKMVRSFSIAEGSLLNIFKNTLLEYCNR